VQGGAYGAMVNFDRLSGVLAYLSYRDPNLLQTIEVYNRTVSYLTQLELNEQELTKAIIGSIGDMDAYQLPDAKGFTALLRHLVGVNDDLRQKLRNEILSTKVADFRIFGELLAKMAGNEAVVVLGPPGAMDEVNSQKPGWLTITRVL
jgi:Zn-dependent M16 (insulinase) family peptidase